jgi:hypothetical protein
MRDRTDPDTTRSNTDGSNADGQTEMSSRGRTLTTKRIIVAALVGGIAAVATTVSPAFAAGSGYGPGQPPVSGPPGFGRIIEAKTIGPTGGQVAIFVPSCLVTVVVPASTFSRPVELVLTSFDDSGISWGGFSSRSQHFQRVVCGIGVTVYSSFGSLERAPFPKPLAVSFTGSDINSDTAVAAVATFNRSTNLNATITGHTATVGIESDSELAAIDMVTNAPGNPGTHQPGRPGQPGQPGNRGNRGGVWRGGRQFRA